MFGIPYRQLIRPRRVLNVCLKVRIGDNMTSQNSEEKTAKVAGGKKIEKRRRGAMFQVRVTAEEHTVITERATKIAGLKAPSFMRKLALGYKPNAAVDSHALLEMLRLHGDLNRVGGLIKLWLSERDTKLPPEARVSVLDLHKVVGELRAVTKNLEGVIKEIKGEA